MENKLNVNKLFFRIRFMLFNSEASGTYIYHFQSNVSLMYVEIKCQLDATEVFIADLIACSTCFYRTKYHRQQPLYNTLELLMMGIMMPETC